MSWFSSAKDTVVNAVSNAIPNEIKNAIPNEIKPFTDPLGVTSTSSPSSSSSGPAAVSAGTAAPTYDDTLLKAFNAQLAIEPQLLAANQLYQPQWLALQQQSQNTTAQGQMDLMSKLYPQSGTIEAAYQNQLRQNELGQLKTTLLDTRRH